MMRLQKIMLFAVLAMTTCTMAHAQDSVAVTAPSGPWTLQQCIDYAKQQNITIKKNKVSAEEAQISIKQAKAQRGPSLSFSTSQGLSNRPFQETSALVNGSQVLTSSSKTSYTGNYALNANMTLWDGGNMQNNIKLAELDSKIADLTVAQSENSIEEEITRLYVQILYSIETVKQDSATWQVSVATWERGKALLKAGTLNLAEVSQLESQAAQDKYQIVADQTTLDGYYLQLKQLLELDGDYNFQIASNVLDADALEPLPSKQDVYANALQLRPEIQASQLQIDRSDLNLKIAKAGKMPTVSLSAGTSTLNMSSNGNFWTQLKNQWSNTLGLSLSIPILDKRSTKSAVEKAKLAQQTSQLNLQEEQKNLWKTIENYWLEANSAQQRFAAAKERTKSAQTSYDLTREQFRLGLKNIIELITDKNSVDTATQQQIQSKYTALLNAALLKYYAGNAISF